MPEETKKEVVNVFSLNKRVKELEDKVEKLNIPTISLIQRRTEELLPMASTDIKDNPGSLVHPKLSEAASHHVPIDWVDIIKKELNSDFGISIIPSPDRPVTEVIILVPQKYSPLSKEAWDYSKGDIRSKVIGIAEGSFGVETWAKGVFNSFSPEMKAMIKMDGIQNPQ